MATKSHVWSRVERSGLSLDTAADQLCGLGRQHEIFILKFCICKIDKEIVLGGVRSIKTTYDDTDDSHKHNMKRVHIV